MPLRNLIIIVLSVVVSWSCYAKSYHNRYVAIIAKAMRVIESRALEPVDQRELFEGAMNGMVSTLDQHSAFYGPSHYQRIEEQLDQEFGGIGINVQIGPKTKRLMVLDALIDTPALRAGLRPGDVILEIEGKSTKGMTIDDCVKRMKGKPGESVNLVIQHRGESRRIPLRIEREIIRVPSVIGYTRRSNRQWNFFLTDHPRIGYIELESFGKHTTKEMEGALAQIKGRVDALILDVRGNSGGLLPTAIEVCDLFIDKGVVVSTSDRDGNTLERFEATKDVALDRRIPMVVLVNQGSASASEILAACLQDHGRAKIVGQRSYGKGTVQNIIELERNKSALKLTTAGFSRPSGKNIHRSRDAKEDSQWGVKPDKGLQVVLTDADWINVLEARRDRIFAQAFSADGRQAPDSANRGGGEDLTSSLYRHESRHVEEKNPKSPFKDAQLERAVKYLLSKTHESGARAVVRQ